MSSSTAESTQAVLEVANLSLAFGSVQALRDVSLSIRDGEITALVGDNGAGKSTLVRCIAGIHQPDEGTITFDGAPVSFSSPDQARQAGIETVHQDLALVEDLTVWQNLFLNREITAWRGPLRLLAKGKMRREAEEMVARLAVNVPSVTSTVRRLSGGQRQAVAICRSAGFSSRLVIMDEPTAALGVQETERVQELILRLRDDGHPVLMISHNFEQVVRLADHVWIMRSGRCVAGRRISETDPQEIVGLVTGAISE